MINNRVNIQSYSYTTLPNYVNKIIYQKGSNIISNMINNRVNIKSYSYTTLHTQRSSSACPITAT